MNQLFIHILQISPENTLTQSLVTNFLSFNTRQNQSNHYKQYFLITTSNISHCLKIDILYRRRIYMPDHKQSLMFNKNLNS